MANRGDMVAWADGDLRPCCPECGCWDEVWHRGISLGNRWATLGMDGELREEAFSRWDDIESYPDPDPEILMHCDRCSHEWAWPGARVTMDYIEACRWACEEGRREPREERRRLIVLLTRDLDGAMNDLAEESLQRGWRDGDPYDPIDVIEITEEEQG